MRSFKQIILSFILVVTMLFSASFTNAPPVKAASSIPDVSNLVSEECLGNVTRNLDIDVGALEQNKYLGLYYDSFAGNNTKESRLYLCWTSEYMTITNATILQFTENGRTYGLYSSKTDLYNKNGNWPSTMSKEYPEENLIIHMTPIGGISNGQSFGIPLKRNYKFENFYYGQEGTYQAIGQCNQKMEFDLGIIPSNDGKNSLQLVTHAYEIIKDCEAQSFTDLFAYGGTGHFVYFNLNIPVDKIYRVDVKYKITNDNRSWWDFWRPYEEHLIRKSLTTERVRGGIFNFAEFQGLEEGQYRSTIDERKTYRFRLHLNYDDDAWNLFETKPIYEADYKRISKFEILRMNYVSDNTTFDVKIKMDTVEGDTLNILDPELILDANTRYYDDKNAIDDFFRKATDWMSGSKEEAKKGVGILLIVLAAISGVVVLVLLIRFLSFLWWLLKPKRKDDNNE